MAQACGETSTAVASADALPGDIAAELQRLRRENTALRELVRASSKGSNGSVAATQQGAQQAEAPTPAPALTPAGPKKAVEPMPLSTHALPQLEAAAVEVPKYARDARGVGKWIMHLGLGGFSRSHLAMLTDELLTLQHEQREAAAQQRPAGGGAPERWGICGVGLMPWDVKLRDALAAQDHMYVLLSRDSIAGDNGKVIGSIMDYIFVPDDPKAGLDRLAHPSTAIVSLTVTEKGYCLDSSGNLDFANPLVKHDLSPGGLEAPQSALGVIIAALRLRRDRGVPPFTVLSCDNLPMNGHLARRMVVALATKVDTGLAEWIASPAVAFPSSMVDRITPVTKQADMDLVRETLGIVDRWPVVAEPFVQWVVEDFGGPQGGRPGWESCSGVQFVADVKPYELMKLRLLNSSHSALAYVGYLAGYRYVHDAMADPLVRSFMTRYMASVAPTVPPVPGVNLSEYQATLIRRFSNARIADTLLRLAQDGSAKWRSTLALGGLAHSALGAMQFAGGDLGSDPPLFTKFVRNAEDLAKLQAWRRDHQRWRQRGSRGAKGEFGANVEMLGAARPAEPAPPDVALGLAAWVRFMVGADERSEPIPLEDPMASALQPLAKAAASPAGSMASLQQFLSLALGEAAASWPQLTVAVARWLTAIKTRGVCCALAEALAESSSLASTPPVAQAGGADLAASTGSSTAHGRLALLKLRQARLQDEVKEVNAQLAITEVEAKVEEEEMARAVQAGARRPRTSSHLALYGLNSPDEQGSCAANLLVGALSRGHSPPALARQASPTE